MIFVGTDSFRLSEFKAQSSIKDADFALISYVRDIHLTGGKQFDEGTRRMSPLVEAVRTHDQQEIRRMLVVCALEFASSRIV